MSDLETAAREHFSADLGYGLGSQFMALLFDTLFAGVLLCQATHWIPNWKHEPSHIRGIVAFGVLAAFATTLFTWINYFTSFVSNFGQFSRFASFGIIGWYALLDMLTVIPVQLVFGERSIKINNKSFWVILLDGTLILGTIAAAIGVIVATRDHTIFDATMLMRVFLLLWPSVCTCTHFTLTSTILFGLIKTRQASRQVNKIVDRIIYMSLESQLPATMFAIAAMITLAANPKSPIVPFIIIVHPKIFMIGCLAMINSRHTWQRDGKIPSTLQSKNSRNSSQPTYTTDSSYPSYPSEPTTPKLGLVRDHSIVSEYDANLHAGLPMTEFESSSTGHGHAAAVSTGSLLEAKEIKV